MAGHVVQAVGTEQPALTRFDLEGIQVQFRAGVDVAEDAHQDVLVRMGFRFFGAEPALIDEALDEGVVHADLLEFAVPQPVRAGVANMGEVQLALGQQEGGDRGPHAGQLGIDVDEFGEQRVGGLDLVGKDGAGVAVVVVAVEMEHVQHRGGRSDITAGVSAHAIGDDGEVAADVGGVVVLRAHPADVGPRGVAHDERPLGGSCFAFGPVCGKIRGSHGYGLNSMTVLPILTGTPSSTGSALVSCWSAR